MDRRKGRTEKAFKTALFHFLQERDMGSITVKELCDYADLNRGTFYLHYYDINDLLDKTEQTMVDMIFTPIREDADTLVSDILHTFDYIKAHKDEYKVILRVKGGSGFMQKLIAKTTDHWMPKIKEMLPDSSDAVARAAVTIHIGGMMAMLYDWVVEQDCKTPPEDIIRAVSDITDYIYIKKLHYQKAAQLKNT